MREDVPASDPSLPLGRRGGGPATGRTSPVAEDSINFRPIEEDVVREFLGTGARVRGTGVSSGVAFLRPALDLTFPELLAARTEIQA